MELSELRAATNDLLDDLEALAGRYQQDGCLLVRGALGSAALAAVIDQATSVLVRCGVADHRCGLRWTGAPVPDLDDIGINDIPALDDLVHQIDGGSDPLRPVADRVCGHPMHIWRALHIFAAVPDDPSHVTAPHQDNFAVNTTGDYRRLWIALTDIPFGDGGLGLAVGSHRRGRLPRRELRDPGLVNDHWHTASMEPGDLIVFRPDVVHRGLPATSDRIRMALAVIASATSDPLPHTMYTGPENRARHNRVRELAAPLGLSELELFGITADLTRAGVAIEEETVRAAVRGDYSPR
ncbi:MAG: phytanoyl-CoA dioxygenase family protein [Pseudonocardiaceae bacterium]